MGTTAEKLTYLGTTKNTLKANLISKGMTIPQNTTFRRMAEMVGEISAQTSKYKVTVNVNNGIYSITIDEHTLNSGETYEFEAEAGQIVNFDISSDVGYSLIENTSKIRIPAGYRETVTKAPPVVTNLLFVMPKGNVTLEGP